MNAIITQNGEYLTNTFIGAKGIWVLIGTKSGIANKAIYAIDTFRNKTTGIFWETIRQKVFDYAEKGDIWKNDKSIFKEDNKLF